MTDWQVLNALDLQRLAMKGLEDEARNEENGKWD
jgi:hypothetical protein